MIAGFTVIRDGFRSGYPFLEAIRSVLPLCDEVHVSDGRSSDGTFAALQRSFATEPKVRLRQDPWPEARSETVPGGGSPIRRALNRLRDGISAEVLFQFDCNDILPPEDVPALRELPELFPRRELFALPYRQFLGRYWFHDEFRFRLVRNVPSVRVLWDGWTMGYHLRPADLLRGATWRRFAARSAFALLGDRVALDFPEQYVELPRPIFRYYGLFPETFFEKMRRKEVLQSNPNYRALTDADAATAALLEAYRRTGEYDAFWKGILELQRGARARGAPINKEFPYARYVPDADHPPGIRPVIGRAAYEEPGARGASASAAAAPPRTGGPG
jgi:hypothetical protein